MKELKARLIFVEELLGTSPNNADVYRDFIASKAPDAGTVEDEIAAVGVDGVIENGMTVFPRNADGEPIMYDYQIKGFFKDACSMLARLGGKSEKGKKKPVNESSKLPAYKKIIDGLIFVAPRQIPIVFDGVIGSCQRPLRAQTAQGERVALANSETIPEGAHIDVTIKCLSDEHEAAVREWLDYGELRGLGQWRNSGKGRLLWDELDDAGNVIGGNHDFKARK